VNTTLSVPSMRVKGLLSNIELSPDYRAITIVVT
jgi:hypothetical protein